MGGSVGAATAQLLHRPRSEKDFLVTGGAAAGLAAAFNAPVSGVVFALEELHRHFSPRVLLKAMTAAFVSDFRAANIFGFQPVLAFHQVAGAVAAVWCSTDDGRVSGAKRYCVQPGHPAIQEPVCQDTSLLLVAARADSLVLTGIVLLIVPDLFGSGEEMIFLPGAWQPAVSAAAGVLRD